MIVKGGNYNNIDFSCMFDACDCGYDFVKTEKGVKLYGIYGIAVSLNDAPAILWFDEQQNFVKGELEKQPEKKVYVVNCLDKECKFREKTENGYYCKSFNMAVGDGTCECLINQWERAND